MTNDLIIVDETLLWS